MRFIAAQPASIGKILDASIKLYIAGFPKLIGFYLLSAVLQIGFVTLNPQVNPAVTAWFSAQFNALSNILPLLIGMGIILILAISALFATIYIGIIYRIDHVVRQIDDSFGEALGFGLKKMPSMLWGYLLYGLAVVVGYLLLLIPGIVLTLSMSFFIYFIGLESKSAYASLRASHSLVWGHWWRTLGVYMAPGIVFIVLISTLGFVFALLTPNSLISAIAVQLFSVLITPYFFSLGYVQFHDLKLRKSGADLENRLG